MSGRAEYLGLEPASISPNLADDISTLAYEGEIEQSKAISLKRIADALWGTPDTTGIVQLLNFIERKTTP